MSNRILKESIRTSNEIDALSWFEETLFYRLIVTVDDYGIYPADPVLLMHMLFPMKETITRGMMEEALGHLEDLGLILRYRVENRLYLQICSWEKHQRIRNSRRIFPGPEESTEKKTPRGRKPKAAAAAPAAPGAASASASAAAAVPAAAAPAPVASSPGEEPAVESSGAEEPAAFTEGPADAEGGKEAPAAPPVILLPLNDGSEYAVSQEEADEYTNLYPAVDVLQELRGMRGWLNASADRRKTRSGIRRFMNNWLSRAQNQARPAVRGPVRQSNSVPNPFEMLICEGEVQ